MGNTIDLTACVHCDTRLIEQERRYGANRFRAFQNIPRRERDVIAWLKPWFKPTGDKIHSYEEWNNPTYLIICLLSRTGSPNLYSQSRRSKAQFSKAICQSQWDGNRDPEGL